MSEVDVMVWLAAGYGGFLLLAAYGLDLMARRASAHSAKWHSGAFTYHADHDAWICPEDQWLWPQSFDPENRVMRYRASPAVCNACPVRDTCTTSPNGREISRNVDPWPNSEAERFHRGIACALVVLGLLWPLTMLIGHRTGTEQLVLLASIVVISLGSWPLWSHLRRTPAAFPEDVPVERPDERAAAQAIERARELRRRTGYASDRRAAASAGPAPPDVPTRTSEQSAADRERFATVWRSFEDSAGADLPGGSSRRKR